MERVIQEAFEEAVRREYDTLLDNLASKDATGATDEDIISRFRIGYWLAKRARGMALEAVSKEDQDMKEASMTPEALRTLIVQGIDEVFGRPLLLALLSTEQKKALAAQRSFWSQQNAPFDDVSITVPSPTRTVTGLLTYYQNEEKSGS